MKGALKRVRASSDSSAAQAASKGPASSFRAALCGAPLLHFGTRPFDSGFGCGWRNLQMLCGSLLHLPGTQLALRQKLLFGGARFVPDVPALQAWLEAAWEAGFDQPGREQLGGRVQGMPSWIGAVDAAALLRSFGLRAQIVDFKAPPAERLVPGAAVRHAGVECDACAAYPIVGPRFVSASRPNFDLCGRCASLPAAATSGPFRRLEAPLHYEGAAEEPCEAGAHAPLVEFMWNYFTSDARGAPLPLQLGGQIVTSPQRPPLFLQHDGHSRTVVGVERRRRSAGAPGEEIFLLIFDPSTNAADLQAALEGNQTGGWQRLLKRGLGTLRKREYSVLMIHEGELERGTDAWEVSKVICTLEPTSALHQQ